MAKTKLGGVFSLQQIMETPDQTYDYIVCGAGSAGSVVAGRLAANPAIRVLLLEAGGPDVSETVTNPNFWPRNLGGDMDWGFKAIANPRLNGRAIPYSMGKVLGGGSSINVCTWARGHKSDWDSYATQTGDSRWNYDSILKIYKRVEDWQGTPDSVRRGRSGPVFVQPAFDIHPLATALLDAASGCGLPTFPDANGRLMESAGGASYIDEAIHRTTRQSLFRSYVHPLLGRPNLHVVTNTLVSAVIVEAGRATGITVTSQGQTHRFKAGCEVILTLGAIHTPKVLMQSGIGDPGELKNFGIVISAALPAVGRNLHDHVAVGCTWEGADDAALPAIPRTQAVCFWKSHKSDPAPSNYCYAVGGPRLTSENSQRYAVPQKAWSLFLGSRPSSRGRVSLTGKSPDALVKIDAGYLADSADMLRLREAVAFCRNLGNSSAFAPCAKREIAPGPLSEDSLSTYIRNGLVTFWHQCGTAKMGTGDDSVVDSRLRVHGVEGLRVADASVLPHVTVANTMAPTVAVAELATDFLMETGIKHTVMLR